MSRPLRIEYAGAVYHLTSRGNARQDIYLDDDDRRDFLDLLAGVCRRHGWLCHSYCLMSNHYHLLIETPDCGLSKGMKLLNGQYTQAFNKRHRRVGHVFQGRFKAILVERDSYLLELCRYIVLNPVRARMVRTARDWPWSSYRALVGRVEPVAALTTDWVLRNFGRQRKKSIEGYRAFVAEGKNQPSPWESLTNQIYLGSDTFVEDAQCQLSLGQSLVDIPRPQKQSPPKELHYYVDKFEAKEGMARAYLSGHYTLTVVGEAFGVSYATVSRAAKAFESCQM